MRGERTVERRQRILVDAPEVGQHVELDVHVGQVWHEVVAYQESEQDPIVDYALQVIVERELTGGLDWKQRRPHSKTGLHTSWANNTCSIHLAH